MLVPVLDGATEFSVDAIGAYVFADGVVTAVCSGDDPERKFQAMPSSARTANAGSTQRHCDEEACGSAAYLSVEDVV